ncbi:polysaccharide biosynthesis/export family protein [uncultured Bacteroides sp.]|uniref:polysaccharide biosynthesis/export family protein n=1 Tax=uncultured Bacteroides sp. TaxID=162156 RepID=UPI002AAB8697|nr:polysaccharide biosynthesis/export family protein [uncultured Bacteroides sp.]
MINKRTPGLLLLVLVAVLISSCKSAKNVAYLQDVESLSQAQLAQSAEQYSAKIKPNDLLRIVVSGAEDVETYLPYNLITSTAYSEGATYGQLTLQSYLVDSKGEIDFPQLGKLNVVNKTSEEVSKMIVEKLKTYLKGDLVVTVRFASYKVSVLGEVARPGIFTIKDEKINILQALALAGDLTIYGRRDVVKVIREGADGKKTITTLNLNSKNLLLSPYYNLQQNDVVYVEPNKAKAKGASIGSGTYLGFTIASVLVGVASLVVNILK